MNNGQPQIDAIRALGYSEQESRFLYLVATHSGYFVARQFLGFTGGRSRQRTSLFWTKLQASQHARIYRFAQSGTVYHLFSRKIYRQIGDENLPNRREHEFEYIRTRIAGLDFVLGNLDSQYLETESDKVAYFCSELNVPTQHLPGKSYADRRTAGAVVRYFADRYPMFIPRAPLPRTVVFTYLQGPEASLAGFAHHLRSYLPLFRELAEFKFLFLARTDCYFGKAHELFRDLVTIPLEPNPADDLLRYFKIRKAWDLAEYASVTEGDLMFHNLAKERFRGARVEHFYRAWKVGRISDAEIHEDFQGSDKPHVVHFETEILRVITGPAIRQTCRQRNPHLVAAHLPAGKEMPERETESRGAKKLVSETHFEGGVMPIVKKAPDILTREVRMEEPVSALLDDYAQFIESSPDHVVNSVLKKTLWSDQDYRKWRNQRRSRTEEAPPTASDPGTTP
jgi:hypothetical protein